MGRVKGDRDGEVRNDAEPCQEEIPSPYRLDQDWIGTVEIAFCGDPSITRSL